MPGLNDQELADYIDELTRVTQHGLIAWNRENPTTFVWTRPEQPSARLALQQIKRTIMEKTTLKSVPYYILQVFEIKGEKSLVLREDIDGRSSGVLNEKLRVLFELIRKEKAQKDIDFLRGILPQQKRIGE